MAVINSDVLINDIATLRANPAISQQYFLNLLENLTNGDVLVVDPTNPFVFLMECAVIGQTAAMQKSSTNTRYQYQNLATEYQDLYRHMSDDDYIGRFSEPSRVEMYLLLGLDEIKQKVVLENSSGVRRLTIPRYARFTVNDLVFTTLYPIDIRVMPHGGINVTYDVSQTNPIETIATNVVDYRLLNIDNNEWLELAIPVKQLDILRATAAMSGVTTFTREYTLGGKYFYYCRAFNQVDGKWVEMHTTHSDKVYDPYKPTAILKVLNDTLMVTIPSVYFNSNLINDAVRFDIYVTDGPVDLSLDGVDSTLFQVKWVNLPNEAVSPYTAPLDTFNAISIYSTDTVTGGSLGISFNELRERVVTRSTVTEGLPITGKQLNNKLRDMGYSLVTNVDNITDRQFLATRQLPAPTIGSSVTAMTSAIQTLNATIGEIVVNSKTVNNNEHRLTILPSTLYSFSDGILSIVPDTRHTELTANKNPASLASIVNNETLLFSPFYYVLDKSATDLRCRVYDLNSRKFESRFFFQTNQTIGHVFNVKSYRFANIVSKDGYVLETELDIDADLLKLPAKHLTVEMSYLDVTGGYRHYIKGALFNEVDSDGLIVPTSDGKVLYQFKILTNYDVDPDDNLVLLPEQTLVGLTHEFDIVTCIGNGVTLDNYQLSDIDSIVSDKKVWHGINQEKIVLSFGKNLKHLYQRTRTVVKESAYARRTTDKPMVYEKDVYETDSTGTPIFTINPTTMLPQMTKLHDKGDVIIAENGNALYEWRIGDVILDALGNPVIDDYGQGLKISLDIYLLDAKYVFGNTDSVIAYREQVIDTVADWCINDMDNIADQLLERSEIFYHPTSTAANIYVNADNNVYVATRAEQRLTVTYYLTESKYNNTQLRKAISEMTAKKVNEALNRTTVSVDTIVNYLRLAVGNDVIGVTLSGFLNNRYSVATLTDDAMRLSVGKRLVPLANGLLDVTDDITIEFVKHDESY